MMLAMTTTENISDPLVHHDIGVMSRGHSGLRPSSQMCPSTLLASLLVSREVCMAEGDAAASVGRTGGSGSPLLHAGAVPVVVALPWTPR